MSDTDDRQDGAEPGKRDNRTIAEASRARWAPGHPDAQEAGDDGPHTTRPTDDVPSPGEEADDPPTR